MKKVITSLLIVILAFSMVFLGISCKEESVEETAEKEEVATEEEPTEEEPTEEVIEEVIEEDIWGTDPITINLWTWQTSPAYREFYNYVATEYNRLHPNVTVDWLLYEIHGGGYNEALKAAIVGGEGPDLFGIYPGATGLIGDFVDSEVLLDLTDVITNDEDWSYWIEPTFDYKELYFKDKIYLCPQSVQHRSAFFWKDMWPNGFPKTYDELFEEVERIKPLGLIPFDAAGLMKDMPVELFLTLVFQQDPTKKMPTQAEYGEISWENDVFKTALEKGYELFEKGAFPEDLMARQYAEDVFETFLAKKSAAMWYGGEWFVSAFEEEDLNADAIGWAPLPTIDENAEQVIVGGIGATEGINADSEYVEIAIDVLKLTNSPEAQKILFSNLATPPGAHMIKESSGIPLFDKMVEVQGSRKMQVYFFDHPEIIENVYYEFSKIFLGEISVDEGLANIQAISDSLN